MRQRWAASIAMLALYALIISTAHGQRASSPPSGGQRVAGALGRNDPNPFNPDTKIPFSIGLDGSPPACTTPGRLYTVSLRIYDEVARHEATPILQGGGQQLAGQPVDQMRLACGTYTAFWDGNVRNTNRKAASGVKIAVLTVDGKPTSRKMLVTK